MAMLFFGSLLASAARLWWYSSAEMPGVRSPGAIRCGWVSWSGWPNWHSAAETSVLMAGRAGLLLRNDEVFFYEKIKRKADSRRADDAPVIGKDHCGIAFGDAVNKSFAVGKYFRFLDCFEELAIDFVGRILGYERQRQN